MLVNVEVSFPPTEVTAPMIATEIKAAIMPYSIAVAPDSSDTKRSRKFLIEVSFLKLQRQNYFSEELTLVNVEVSLPPTDVTAPIIATEIRAAIKPYSIAVAPESSFIKRVKKRLIEASFNRHHTPFTGVSSSPSRKLGSCYRVAVKGRLRDWFGFE